MHKRTHRLKAFFSQPANVILVFFAVVLTLLTLYPLIELVYNSFVINATDAAIFSDLKKGMLSLRSWQKLLFTKANKYSLINFYRPLVNSLLYSILSAVLALVFGGSVAWLMTRSNLKAKKWISAAFVFPYILPSWTLALFWINMFRNPNVGIGVAGFVYSLTGWSAPTWFVYGLFPLVIVSGLHYAPFAYIFIGGILRNMDANLEEAATVLKTPRWRIFQAITLPIVKPAVLSTFLLVFASVMGSYAVPVYLGSPVNFFVLTTKMKMLQTTAVGQAYIIAMFMVASGSFVLLLNNLLVGKRQSYTTVTGKSSQISLVDLKAGKYIISVILCILMVFICVMPLISFALESVLIKAGDYSLSNMTLNYWIGGQGSVTSLAGGSTGILLDSLVWKAGKNSLLLSFICALLAGSSGLIIGYAVVRKKNTKLANYVSGLSFFPYLIPSMAFSAIYLAISSQFSFLANSFWLLILVGTVKYLPFASRSGINSMLQLSKEIEEAALVYGVSWPKRMLKIIMPIQKAAIISGFLLPFVSCMRELSLFVMLVSAKTQTLTTILMAYSEKGASQYGNAINLLIIILVLVVNFSVNKITGASIDKGLGGN
ncbi:ABC transporter permease [Amygdalobacter nucleatus]|uniref:ABC transporter permease n=1 Tax=Amygdalobacter nucleatus TaxID=3029274 RepID=UPI0027A95BCB|nr:iron ABC transporter permease [Amygdalobacter nucleatus]WEG36965.1 iron ABC transporter permease [Amygdalobacter nucleatus]